MTGGPSTPVLSVCIVSWNTRDLLAACLASLYDDPDHVQWEVIVVDNASRDGTADMVARRYPQVCLIRNPRNAGFAQANNRAMERARGKYLLLLNPDTRVRRGALGGLVACMEQGTRVGAVGPRLTGEGGELLLSCGRTPSLASELVNRLLLHNLLPFFKFGRWNHAHRRAVGWVTGACILVRREVVESVGPLDADLFMFHEDVEWCMRIRRAGWGVVYCPSSEVIHLGGRSVRQDFSRMLVVSQRSLFYVFHKHHGLASVHFLRCLTVAEMVLRACCWIPLTLCSPRRRTEGRERLRAYWTILGRTLADRSYWAPCPRGETSHRARSR